MELGSEVVTSKPLRPASTATAIAEALEILVERPLHKGGPAREGSLIRKSVLARGFRPLIQLADIPQVACQSTPNLPDRACGSSVLCA